MQRRGQLYPNVQVGPKQLATSYTFTKRGAIRMDYKKSEKYIEALKRLPEDLKPIYEEFVSDYRYAATLRHGRPYISYIVLADIVRAGWRCSAEPQKESKEV